MKKLLEIESGCKNKNHDGSRIVGNGNIKQCVIKCVKVMEIDDDQGINFTLWFLSFPFDSRELKRKPFDLADGSRWQRWVWSWKNRNWI